MNEGAEEREEGRRIEEERFMTKSNLLIWLFLRWQTKPTSLGK